MNLFTAIIIFMSCAIFFYLGMAIGYGKGRYEKKLREDK